MLESYYVRPQAVDRIRASWIGAEIEHYVGWLAEQSYSRASVRCRVPVLFAFGEFARAGGARSVGDLPAHVEAFVAERIPAHRAAELGAVAARERVKNVRGPIDQMLCLVVPGFTGSRRRLLDVPFIDESRGSSSTWCVSAVFALPRSKATGVTCGALSATWDESGSNGWSSSRQP